MAIVGWAPDPRESLQASSKAAPLFAPLAQRKGPRISLAIAVLYTVLLQVLAAVPDTSVHATRTPFVAAVSRTLFRVPVELRDLTHIPLYGLLGVLWFWSLAARSQATRRRTALSAALLASVLGVLIELSQLPMATRFFTLRDVTFNVVSAVAGVLLASILARGSIAVHSRT